MINNQNHTEYKDIHGNKYAQEITTKLVFPLYSKETYDFEYYLIKYDLKFRKIKSIVPILTCQIELISQYWLIYEYFFDRYLENIKVMDSKEAEKLQFSYTDINLINFINNYELLENKFTSQNDLELYLKYLNLLYDKEKIRNYINKYITTTQDILLLSYRYRNMIVHNAQYDITFINFYSQQLELIAIRLLNVITSEIYKSEARKDLKNIIINKYLNQKQMINDFKFKNLKEWFNSIDK